MKNGILVFFFYTNSADILTNIEERIIELK